MDERSTSASAEPQAATTPGRLREHRGFRLFWSAETLSNTGTAIGAVALPLAAVVVLHAGPLATGALEAAIWAPWLAVGLLAGAIVDRADQRRLMIGCDLLAALVFALVPLAALLGVLSMALLVVVAFAAGVLNVFSQAARQTYPPLLVDDAQLEAANTWLQASESVSDLAGAPLAGVVTHLLGAVGGIALNATSFLASALLLVRSPPGRRTATAQAAPGALVGSLVADVRAGLGYVWADPWLRGSATAAAVANFALTGVGALQVLLLIRVVALPPAWFGPLLVVEGVGGLLGALSATRLAHRFGTCRTLVVLAISGPMLGSLVVLTRLGWSLGFFVVGAMSSTAAIVAGNVVWAIFRQRYIPAPLLGRASAAIRVIAYAAAPLGALLAGALATQIGIRAAITVLFTCALVRGLLFLRQPWRSARDLPPPAQDPPAA